MAFSSGLLLPDHQNVAAGPGKHTAAQCEGNVKRRAESTTPAAVRSSAGSSKIAIGLPNCKFKVAQNKV